MRILVLGDFIIDEHWSGSSSRLSPEAPVPVITNLNKTCSAGGAANVAMNLHSMGSSTKLISQASVYEDLSIIDGLDRLLLTCSTTPRKTRILANDRVICRLDDERYQAVTANSKWITEDTSICVLSDYNKGFLRDSKDIISWCNSKDIRTIVDPKQPWEHYQGCWLLKANAQELAEQWGQEYTLDQLDTICPVLCERYSITNLVITLGSQGLYIWTDTCGTLIKAVPNHVIDVTGAGDVVLAALAHYTDRGLDLLSAAKRANALAAIAVSKLGVYVITDQDLITVEDRVVFTNGCFDILHKGHIDYLKQSKAYGTKLVVGLNSDRSVRALKGSSRPINSQHDRKAMLESLGCVDEVIIFDEPTPRGLILQVKPDIITKGGDYTVDQVVGNDLVNQVIIIPLTTGYSTTNLLEKINA
jgi:D-beta-D-heptose 7-phosphate kinase/D-beta-D-heptose 1-phosphate adenosyltransferase